jgi:hypothetical protein
VLTVDGELRKTRLFRSLRAETSGVIAAEPEGING